MVPATAEDGCCAESHPNEMEGALTLEHLLQLGLAADGGAAGGRAGGSHSDGTGRIGTARARAAGRYEALAIPALTANQLSHVA